MRIWSGSSSWSTWAPSSRWRTSRSSSAPPQSSQRCPAGPCGSCCLLSAPRPCPSSAQRVVTPPANRPKGKELLTRQGDKDRSLRGAARSLSGEVRVCRVVGMDLKVRLSPRGHPLINGSCSLLERWDLPDALEWYWPDVLEFGHFGSRISRLCSFMHLRH